jgi:hypothetical protein
MRGGANGVPVAICGGRLPANEALSLCVQTICVVRSRVPAGEGTRAGRCLSTIRAAFALPEFTRPALTARRNTHRAARVP